MNPPDLGSVTPPTSESAPPSATASVSATTATTPTTSTTANAPPRVLHATDTASSKKIHRADASKCFVYTDWKDNTPKPPGMMPPPTDVPCPPEMLKAPWDECRGGTLMTTALASECVCHFSGNPPPPSKKLKCP